MIKEEEYYWEHLAFIWEQKVPFNFNKIRNKSFFFSYK